MVRTRTLVLAVAAGCLVGTSALAGPDPKTTGLKGKMPGRHFIGPIAQLPFTDNFDSYQNGAKISTVGTWDLSAPSSPDATVTNSNSNSSPNAMRLENLSDNVQTGSVTSGQITIKAMTFFPSSALGQGGAWCIALNTFQPPTFNWSMQLNWDNSIAQPTSPGMMCCYDGFADGTETLHDIILDKWVEVRAEIDLDTDTWNAFYGDTQVVHNRSWTNGAGGGGGGALEMQCLDLYSSGTAGFLYDDVSVSTGGGCYADCDDSGELDIDDFICFQTLFGFGDPGADCDGSGELDIDDFICYQTAFGVGCG